VKILGRLSLAAVIVAYGEVMLGSWTRINGAGMTCPDYPLCHGEWTHRLTAAVLSLLVLGVLATAWRLRKAAPFVAPTAWVLAALFAFQVFLGAATVHLYNSPVSVVWHWGTAMAFVASLATMAIFAFMQARGNTGTASSRRTTVMTVTLSATAVIAFFTMCVGAYVSSSGAGLACVDIPGCAGNVVVYTPGQYVQMLHRFIAAACLLSAALSFALVWALGGSKRVRITATVGLALVFVQVILGLLNVALRLPIDLREAHAANAALEALQPVPESREQYASAR
jgi:heme A synthase